MEELIKEAICAREKSYSPYSNFKVGAALQVSDGKIYTGCNVENASYSVTVCAERVAFLKALSEGERDFKAIAIVCGEDYCYPCGVCRQFMDEFVDARKFEVIVANPRGDYMVYKLIDLFPHGFKLKEVEK